MLRPTIQRLRNGKNTLAFPPATTALPNHYRGVPVIDRSSCKTGCVACEDACPTNAIDLSINDAASVDLGRCLFCSDCVEACPEGAIEQKSDYRLASRQRKHLISSDGIVERAESLELEARRVLGHSLHLRQVSAGGCNGCESDLNVLNTTLYDLSRFGIQFVASPRHADGLIVTGPLTNNMVSALESAWAATPTPKFAIAVGACAISGGIYQNSPACNNGISDHLPIDLFIPVCPPHPVTILDGLLRLLGQID